MKLESINFVPRLLGYLGLLPFIAPTIFLFIDSHHTALLINVLVSYGAVILSFLGALYWAFAMVIKDLTIKHRNTMLVWSVIPSILAWIAMLIPPLYGLAALTIFFVIVFLIDGRLSKLAHLPAWYLTMRLRLTVVVTFCLIIASLWLSMN